MSVREDRLEPDHRFLESFPARIRAALVDDLNGVTHERTMDMLEGWDNLPVPASIPERYNANISFETIRSIAHLCGAHRTAQEARDYVLGHLMVYAGGHLADNEAGRWVRLATEFSHRHSFAYATLQLFGNRRVSMRVLPPSYRSQPRLQTPIQLHTNERQSVAISFDDGHVRFLVSTSRQLLPLDSARVIAYLRTARGPEHIAPKTITINPLLGCSERCNFCFRQYDTVGQRRFGALEQIPLFRLAPADMSRYIAYKFRTHDFPTIGQIGLVTGAYRNFDDLYTYTSSFLAHLARETDQGFNPHTRQHQELLILTHLVTERAQMAALKALGVHHLEHTLEVIGDETRQRIMPQQSRNPSLASKGSVSFSHVLSFIADAVAVFGEDKFSVALIIGLDDYDTTVRGLDALHRAGLRRLSCPVFQPYSYDAFGDMAMSFEEVMRIKRHAELLFVRRY